MFFRELKGKYKIRASFRAALRKTPDIGSNNTDSVLKLHPLYNGQYPHKGFPDWQEYKLAAGGKMFGISGIVIHGAQELFFDLLLFVQI